MRPIRYIFGTLVLLLSVSCLKDRIDETATRNSESERTIEITLSDSQPTAEQAQGVTRAIDDIVANEGVVNRLDVFFFGTSGACLFYPTDEQLIHNRSQKKVTIRIPDGVYAGLAGVNFTVYVIANRPANLGRTAFQNKTLAQLKAFVVENETAAGFNADAAPGDFFMTGESAVVSVNGNQNQQLGSTVTLKRAAAKIVVDIVNAKVDGYTPGAARVRVTNYLDKSVVGHDGQYSATAADYKANGWRSLSGPAVGDPNNPYEMDIANALYSYSNDWRGASEKETFITLELEWKRISDNSSRLYYYRIPFSYINAGSGSAAEENRDRIRRNFVYKFEVDVTRLGGLDPELAVDIVSNFDVIDWSTKEIDVSIQSFEYLFVYNPVVETYDGSTTYEWEYRSSLDVKSHSGTKISRAWCIVYTAASGTGTVPGGREVNYLSPLDSRLNMTFREDGGRTYVKLHGWTPINYVPLNIEATLANAAGLTTTISLSIFPPGEYVTATASTNTAGGYPVAGAYLSADGNVDQGSSATASANPLCGANMPEGSQTLNSSDLTQTNFNFYRITTASLPDREIRMGTGTTAELRKIMLGDPSMAATNPFDDGRNPYNVQFIETDPNKNHIVSPEFVVASQRGITYNNRTWAMARERCRRYRESQYPAGTWRVPTFAELAMLGDMQNDSNSAIKNLFVMDGSTSGWWTALQYYNIRASVYSYSTATSPTGVINGGTAGSASVRCVHDTWKE